MTQILTHQITPTSLSSQEQLQTYCGLDCMVMREVHQEVLRLHNDIPQVYSFEQQLQGPYLEIMLRGFKVDELERQLAARHLRQRIEHLQSVLDRLAVAVWGRGLNPRSYQQLQDFFYSKMRLPEIWISQKGQKKLSTNREVLEKLEERHLYARPFVGCILAIRDLAKQLQVFETEITPAGRFHTSYNIAGTETGRPSSSESAFGNGGNAQNIASSLRYVFVADTGYKLCVIDLEQVEARDVGFFCGCLFDDWAFLDACEQGDLHTANAKRVWPELAWPGDPKGDRLVAEQQFYRDFTYRDMAKRGSHLSNYSGTAWTASRSLKVPLPIMEEFQARYCRGAPAKFTKWGGLISAEIEPAYGCIQQFWQWVISQLQTTGELTTPFGRKRRFFGRPEDSATWREAIAFLPQSTTADRMNLGMWRVWKHQPEVQLLAQTYDSITFQFKETTPTREAALISEALDRLKVELVSPSGRSYIVPGEAKVGWNWGNRVTKEDVEKAQKKGQKLPRRNEDGLRKWSANAPDDRQRTTGLNRVML